MIVDLHRQSLYSKIKRWSLGDRPRYHHSAHFQPNIIMEMGCTMFLHSKDHRPIGGVIQL